MKNKSQILMATAILIVGVGAFFGGMKYQETHGSNKAEGLNGRNRTGQFQRGMGGQGMMMGQRGTGGLVMGEIISSDDKSITVKLADGSSKIVLLSDSVTVSKTDIGSKTDLKTGVKVGVFGTTNSDGTVTAQNVQLNPMFRMGMGQPQPSTSASN